jgi:hypothetical protein
MSQCKTDGLRLTGMLRLETQVLNLPFKLKIPLFSVLGLAAGRSRLQVVNGQFPDMGIPDGANWG